MMVILILYTKRMYNFARKGVAMAPFSLSILDHFCLTYYITDQTNDKQMKLEAMVACRAMKSWT